MTTALEASKALRNVGALVFVLGAILYVYLDFAETFGDCNPCGPPIAWFVYPPLFGLCLIALGLAFWLWSREGKPPAKSIQGEKSA